MEWIEARVLIRNLLNRVEVQEDGHRVLKGVLTDAEWDALNFAASMLENSAIEADLSYQDVMEGVRTTKVLERAEEDEASLEDAVPQIELDLTTLELEPPGVNARLCLDFGTAMSKATLVRDEDESETEEIHVLKLGIPADQEEISEVMLISSVYIDNEGTLWFGKQAIDRSMIEGEDGSRQRLDNIKRRLSEEGWEEQVGSIFNPTETPITNGDMVLAYLMYLNWMVNHCLADLGFPKNLPRRFAMPCLGGEKGRETVHRLRRLLGEAQVLADTFADDITAGIPLSRFAAAVEQLRKQSLDYDFITEDITEPLGVAGSIMSWKAPVNMLLMVVDVGAGTSDFSLYRINYEPGKANTAVEVDGSSRAITEAGNHLDHLLVEFIIKKSGVTSDDPMWVNIRSALQLQIRDLKESLFNDQFLVVSLLNGVDVEIELQEFLELEAAQRFGKALKGTMIDILQSIDDSWINWVTANPQRRLVVALTGGGSELPMVRELAEGEIDINGKRVPLAPALPVPKWLSDLDENLDDDYHRIAVSLGGARRRLIQRGGAARITAGDVVEPAKLGGYYTKGV